MPRGATKGERRGGRQKGTSNKTTAANARAVAESGLTRLEYMINVMRDKSADPRRRDDLAKAAAPFVHQRPSPLTQPALSPLNLSAPSDAELDLLEKLYLKMGVLSENCSEP
jgi:hypothetical protein